MGNVLFWQQGVVASQYSYSSSSYPGQQAATPSSATSAIYAQPQAYLQQTYTQQTYAQQQVHISKKSPLHFLMKFPIALKVQILGVSLFRRICFDAQSPCSSSCSCEFDCRIEFS